MILSVVHRIRQNINNASSDNDVIKISKEKIETLKNKKEKKNIYIVSQSFV